MCVMGAGLALGYHRCSLLISKLWPCLSLKGMFPVCINLSHLDRKEANKHCGCRDSQRTAQFFLPISVKALQAHAPDILCGPGFDLAQTGTVTVWPSNDSGFISAQGLQLCGRTDQQVKIKGAGPVRHTMRKQLLIYKYVTQICRRTGGPGRGRGGAAGWLWRAGGRGALLAPRLWLRLIEFHALLASYFCLRHCLV